MTYENKKYDLYSQKITQIRLKAANYLTVSKINIINN